METGGMWPAAIGRLERSDADANRPDLCREVVGDGTRKYPKKREKEEEGGPQRWNNRQPVK
jgi:hypothetical protein